MLVGLYSLMGKTIEAVKLERPAFDLGLRFSDELVLKIFCDQTNLENDDSNYSLHMKDKIYIVGPRDRIRFEIPSSKRPRW